MSQGLVMLDAKGGLVLFNPRYAEILGMPPDQILPGMTVPELMALRTSNSGVRNLDPEDTLAVLEHVLRSGEEGFYHPDPERRPEPCCHTSPDAGCRNHRDVRGHYRAEGGGTGPRHLRGETSDCSVEHVAGPPDARCRGQGDFDQSSLCRDFRDASRPEPGGHDRTGAYGAHGFNLGPAGCGHGEHARSD